MTTTHKTLASLAAIVLVIGFGAQYLTAGYGSCGGGAGHTDEGGDIQVEESQAYGEKVCPATKNATSAECCTLDKSCQEGACAATASASVKSAEKAECTEEKCPPAAKQQKQDKAKAYQEVTPQQLHALLQSEEKVFVFDARSGKYDDGRRIPGATQLDADASAEEIAQVVPDKNATIITYCSNLKCPASKYLARNLAKQGYSNVHKLPVGIDGWEKAEFTVLNK